VSARSALTGSEFTCESSGGIPLFSFSEEVQVREAMQGVCRLVGSSELINQGED
jgi:hypothetical protein